MVKVFFWVEEAYIQSVNLSSQAKRLLEIGARISNKREVDILREVQESFGQVTEINLVDYLNTQLTRPS